MMVNMDEYLDRMAHQQEKIDKLKSRIASDTEKVEKLEASLAKKRASVLKSTEKECIDICLDALVVGAYDMQLKHGMTAPYSHSFYVSEKKMAERINTDTKNPIESGFCRTVTGNSLFEMPKNLYKYLTEKKGWSYPEFKALKEETDKLFKALPDDYTPDLYKTPANSWDRGHIANGYENDGFDSIVRGKCHGTYSSMTTASQNDLAEFLIVCKGFCPDYYFNNNRSGFNGAYSDSIKLVEGVYERHGIDPDLSDLSAWAERNPTRCMSDRPGFISRDENRAALEDRDL